MSSKIAVTVHENNEVTVRDERGLPVVCANCRFSGWLTEFEFEREQVPVRCLWHSGGADPRDGDRVVFDSVTSGWAHADVEARLAKRYPLCAAKNHDGNCNDYVAAKPYPSKPPWWKRLLLLARWKPPDRRSMRE